jgi:hypothetical protein
MRKARTAQRCPSDGGESAEQARVDGLFHSHERHGGATGCITSRSSGRNAYRTARERIERALEDTYRARRASDPERLWGDLPKRAPRRAAKEDIAAELSHLEPRWRRLYVLYPSPSAPNQARALVAYRNASVNADADEAQQRT